MYLPSLGYRIRNIKAGGYLKTGRLLKYLGRYLGPYHLIIIFDSRIILPRFHGCRHRISKSIVMPKTHNCV